MKMSKPFYGKRSLRHPLLHLTFGYHEQRLQWVRGIACKKAICCWRACALRVWVSMFFHTALWLELLCVESAHAAAMGTWTETWSLTRQALNTNAWTCIGLSNLGLSMDTVVFFPPSIATMTWQHLVKSDSLTMSHVHDLLPALPNAD